MNRGKQGVQIIPIPKAAWCDHWVQAGTQGPRPKMVGFYDLVGVAIAPVSKKVAAKRTHG